MKIVILGGAGMMGAGTVKDLVSQQSEGVTQVTVADVSLDRAQKVVSALGDPRLSAAAIDVTDRGAVVALLKDADICINGVPTLLGHQMDIFGHCLEAGVPYVDYGGLGIYTVKQKAFHDAWVKKGATAVLGLGADPGMSNVLCKAAAERLDSIDRIGLYWAATAIGPESPVLVPAYNEATLLAEYADHSKQFLNGRLEDVPPQSMKETIVLPDPFGATEFMCSIHSEPLTVPFARGIKDKGIREFTWKLHLPRRENEAWIAMVKAGFGDYNDPLEFDGVKVTPYRFLKALIARNIERNGHRIPPHDGHEIHFAVGEGTKDGKKTTVKCTVIGGPDPLYDGYVDAGTSMNCSIGVQLMLRHKLTPGVWGPEEYFDTDEYFAELKKRRFTVEVETRYQL